MLSRRVVARLRAPTQPRIRPATEGSPSTGQTPRTNPAGHGLEPVSGSLTVHGAAPAASHSRINGPHRHGSLPISGPWTVK